MIIMRINSRIFLTFAFKEILIEIKSDISS